jgi:hypothetical protein
MVHVAAISGIIGSIRVATDIAKALKGIDLSLEKAELKMKIAELIESLADAKINASEIQDVIREKDELIKELEDAFKIKGEIIRKDDSYYELNEEGNPIGSPYCSGCWEISKILVHLTDNPLNIHIKICPKCKSSYQTRKTPIIRL